MSEAGIFDKFLGAWTGMIAGNNNGLFFENRYGKEPFLERVEGILTSVDRNKHTTWAFNVYDILLRYGGMTDDDTIMEWLLVEEILKRRRLPTPVELGQTWVESLNYRNYGEGRFAVEQFERGIAPPGHNDDDSGLHHTEHAKDWGICAQIYNEAIGLLTYQCPERVRELSLCYGSMVNRREGCEAAVFAIALQNAAMRLQTVPDILEYAYKLLDRDTVFYREMIRARELANKHSDWRKARQEFLAGLAPHSMADAIPNSGLFVMALHYGQGDFADTMCLSIQLGYDTDCTTCTVGGIMGALVGEKAIPPRWKNLLLGVFTNIIWDKWDGCHRYDKYAWTLPEQISIRELAQRTMEAAHIVSGSPDLIAPL